MLNLNSLQPFVQSDFGFKKDQSGVINQESFTYIEMPSSGMSEETAVHYKKVSNGV